MTDSDMNPPEPRPFDDRPYRYLHWALFVLFALFWCGALFALDQGTPEAGSRAFGFAVWAVVAWAAGRLNHRAWRRAAHEHFREEAERFLEWYSRTRLGGATGGPSPFPSTTLNEVERVVEGKGGSPNP